LKVWPLAATLGIQSKRSVRVWNSLKSVIERNESSKRHAPTAGAIDVGSKLNLGRIRSPRLGNSKSGPVRENKRRRSSASVFR